MLHFPQMPHHHHHQDDAWNDDDDYEDDHVLMSLCPHVLILISSSSYLQIISYHHWHLLWTSIKFNLQHLGISIVFTNAIGFEEDIHANNQPVSFRHVSLTVTTTTDCTSLTSLPIANPLKIWSPPVSQPWIWSRVRRIFWLRAPDMWKVNFCKSTLFAAQSALQSADSSISDTLHQPILFCSDLAMWGSPTPLPALLIAAQARFNSRQRDGCRESRACINLPDSSICRGSGAEQEWDFISVIPVFCAPRPPYYPPPLLIHALHECLRAGASPAHWSLTLLHHIRLFTSTSFNLLVGRINLFIYFNISSLKHVLHLRP